ncbi:Rha family transcriptional regulator [Marinomonas aquiplantarum]|uniref:Rha family phage regulatory protein n=1 Tax=Marinomonas aquiplantarum TaxID=491951 RepID=A0A366CXT1_9GAMM|nr:Rha family transcriptional regulator [Marinomonas aquiplantarum]RBO82650.1 Rha family phage regulatory protein [Marinomonas aquiplantarum]
MATDIISSNDAPVVQITNDQITTTSTDLAKCFHKRHDNILRKIENLECSADFHALNFEEMIIDVEVGKGATRQDRAYRITRDGFVFLAMGFTGTKAAQFKEAYINAFNQMEKQHNEQKHLPATTDSNAVAETDKYQLLNNIVSSMKLTSNPVVLPASEITDMIQAIRLYQTQIAQLRTPDWVNDNITRVKDYAQRNFVDF